MNAESTIEHGALPRWMQLHLATITGRPSEDIDIEAPLHVYDLDSVDAVVMALELQKAFGITVHPEIFLAGEQTIAAIARDFPRLTRRLQASGPLAAGR